MPTDKDGETEERILRAARTVFVRHGTAGARMQEIAEEAGVNQALLHYYFRSKDRLAQAVFRDVAGRMVPSIVAVLGSESSIEQKVEQFVHHPQQPFAPAHCHFHQLALEGGIIHGAGGAQAREQVRERRPHIVNQHPGHGGAGRLRLVELYIYPFCFPLSLQLLR